MTPVDQTKFGPQKGDCMSAAVASILEVPLEDVPNLCGDRWLQKLQRWLRKRGRKPVVLDEWPEGRRGYGIGMGMSPRGIRHAVVVRGGTMAHDPYQSRDGLTKTDCYIVFDRV